MVPLPPCKPIGCSLLMPVYVPASKQFSSVGVPLSLQPQMTPTLGLLLAFIVPAKTQPRMVVAELLPCPMIPPA